MKQIHKIIGSRDSFAIEYKILDLANGNDGSQIPYGNVCLWIDNRKLGLFDQYDMLGYFYVDCDTIIHNQQKMYNDEFLFNKDSQTLLKVWQEFKESRSILAKISSDVEEFNNHFFNVRVPLDCRAFDNVTLLLLSENGSYRVRYWIDGIEKSHVIDSSVERSAWCHNP